MASLLSPSPEEEKLNKEWPKGTRVQATGLKSCTSLNGKPGVCLGKSKDGRIAVRFSDQLSSQANLLKPSNLMRMGMSSSSSWSCSSNSYSILCSRALRCLDFHKITLHQIQKYRRLYIEAGSKGDLSITSNNSTKCTFTSMSDAGNGAPSPSSMVFSQPRCTRGSTNCLSPGCVVSLSDFKLEGDIREFIYTGLCAHCQKYLYQKVEENAGPYDEEKASREQLKSLMKDLGDPDGCRIAVVCERSTASYLEPGYKYDGKGPRMNFILRRGLTIWSSYDKYVPLLVAGHAFHVIAVEKKSLVKKKVWCVVIRSDSGFNDTEIAVPCKIWNELVLQRRIDGPGQAVTSAMQWATNNDKAILTGNMLSAAVDPFDPENLGLFMGLMHVSALSMSNIRFLEKHLLEPFEVSDLVPFQGSSNSNFKPFDLIEEFLKEADQKPGNDIRLAANALRIYLDRGKTPPSNAAQSFGDDFIGFLAKDMYPPECSERLFGVEMGGKQAHYDAVGQAVFRCWSKIYQYLGGASLVTPPCDAWKRAVVIALAHGELPKFFYNQLRQLAALETLRHDIDLSLLLIQGGFNRINWDTIMLSLFHDLSEGSYG